MFTQHSPLPRRAFWLSVASLALFTVAGCQPESGDSDADAEGEEDDVGVADQGILAGCIVLPVGPAEARRLFEKETFGGNGRTCLTCHQKTTGTLSPADAQARFLANPADPLFVHDGSDDGLGNGTTRIRADATILVSVALPPNITLANDPTATSVVLRRGIPSLLDTPALDPVLMLDGREPDLPTQALGAIHGHAQSTIEPTAQQLQLIAQHEKTNTFFSSWALYQYSLGAAPPPPLPAGSTAAEKRGRTWFEDAALPTAINSQTPRKGLCATCHAGPLLNATNGFGSRPLPPFPTAPANTVCDQPATQVTPIPAGRRFESALIAEFNVGANPVHNFLLHLPNGAVVPLPPIADPGRALITGNFQAFPADGDLFKFKIPSLRAVSKTAPYFHNNSSKTLAAVVDHYATFFTITTDCNIDGDPPLIMTAQDKADLVAYLKLL